MADDGSMERLTTHYLWTIVSPILLTLGTIGNLLSIAVLTRRSLRSSSASVYLIALSLTDTLVLLTGLLRQFLKAVSGLDVRHISLPGCKIHIWLVYVFLDTSVWILVAFTVERFLSVFTPHKVKSYCTRLSSSLAIAGVVVVMMAINGHMMYGFGDAVKIKNNTTTIAKCYYITQDYSDMFHYVWPWVDFNVFSLCPFVILIIGNSCIYVRLLRRRRKVAATEVTPGTCELRVATISVSLRRVAASTRTDRNSSMTVVLLALNLVFLVTTAPVSVYNIVEPSWLEWAFGSKDSALVELTYTTVNLIMYINNSINFILYCVTGSRFRKELMNIFRKQNVWRPTKSVKSMQGEESISRLSLKSMSPLIADTPETPGTSSRLSQLHDRMGT